MDIHISLSEYKKTQFIVNDINDCVNYLLNTDHIKRPKDPFQLFEDKLRADIDLRLGIISTCKEDKEAPTGVTWHRDASDAIPLDQRIPNDHPFIEANNTLLRCLSRMRAIEYAIHKHTNQNDQSLRLNFAKLTYSILTAAKNATPQTLADTNKAIEELETEFNNYLIKTLDDQRLANGCKTEKDYEALLFHYRILASVLDPAKSLVTIIKDEKNKVIHQTIQHPVTKKTEKQKQCLEEMKPIKNQGSKGKEKKKKNYHTAQKPAIRDANELFYDKIIDDNTQLSAQARKGFLEETKNGWIVTKTLKFPNGDIETTSYVRCGSPVYVGKGETQERLEEHAQENIRQIQQAAKKHGIKFKTTHLTCLLTNSRNESQKTVVEALKSIVDGCDVHLMQQLPTDLNPYQNSCILANNQLYYITPDNQSVVINIKDSKKLEDGINSSRKENTEKVHLSSIDVKTLIIKNDGKQLEQLRPVQMSRIPVNIQGATTETVKLAKLIRKYIKTYKSELDLSCHAGKAKRFNLAARIMEIAEELAKSDGILNILFCNSGQDRTGTVALLFEILWTIRMYQKHGISPDPIYIEELIVKGGNAVEIVPPGSRGIKDDSTTKGGTDKKGALSEASEKQLHTQSAKTNKKNTVSRLPDNPDPAYFRADFTEDDLNIVLGKKPVDIVLTGITNYLTYKKNHKPDTETPRASKYKRLLYTPPDPIDHCIMALDTYNGFDSTKNNAIRSAMQAVGVNLTLYDQNPKNAIAAAVKSCPKISPDASDIDSFEIFLATICGEKSVSSFVNKGSINLVKNFKDSLSVKSLSELQKYVVILALLSSNEGRILKNSVLMEYDFQTIGAESLREKLEKEIYDRTRINKNLLDVLVKKLVEAINNNDEKKINEVIAINKSIVVDLYSEKNLEKQKEPKGTTPSKVVLKEDSQEENLSHEATILNFLETLEKASYLKEFQNLDPSVKQEGKTHHSTLTEIIKIACEVPPKGNDFDIAKFKSDQFSRIKALCQSNTEGFKNWYGKSHTFFGEGRHPVVDIIYRAVLNPDSIYTRIIHNLAQIITNKQTFKQEKESRDNPPENADNALDNYYKNIKYLAMKDPHHDLNIKTLDKLCALDKERIAIKKIDADIDRLTSKWKDGDENATMKLVAYEKLKTQILTSGLEGLDLDTPLENFKWLENQKIESTKQKAPESVAEGKNPTIKEALSWHRHHRFFCSSKPKSMETYDNLLALQPIKVLKIE